MNVKKLFPVISLAAVLWSCGGQDKLQIAPVEVDVYEIKPQPVQIYKEFVGQTFGSKDIAIRARVAGYLEGIHFKEGRYVKKGKLLYTIESQPFEEAVAARMSEVAEAKTRLAKAESDLNRYRPLAEQNAVSKSDLDAAQANYDAAGAVLEAAQANLRAAKINLSYTRVKSPISGLIGKTKAKVGDFVGQEPNPVILNTVSKIDTILVQFFITESQYLSLAKEARQELEAIANGKRAPREGTIELILADGSHFPHPGYFDFIDRGIDPTTGAILVQASFPNPDALLRPGQFARVRIKSVEDENAIIVPQRSVMELQGRYRVYVVSDGKVELRRIHLGDRYHNFYLVEEGLQPGEKIIYEGLQKVRPGAEVSMKTVDVPLIKQEQ